MAKADLLIALGKVIIAAAWADGEITNEEINGLKDLLFRLPDLTEREWQVLDMYIESPVAADERSRLVEDLRHQINTPGDRELVIQTLEDIIAADGTITEDEQQVVEEIKQAVTGVDVSIIGQFSRLFSRPLQRRSAALADAPNRETHLEDFIKNKVYYGVQRRLAGGEANLDIPEDRLRVLSLAGGIMAHIAHVNRDVDEAEITAMIAALQANWAVSATEASFIAEVAISDTSPQMDYFRMTREFVEVCSHEERVRFLDVLFSVATADGKASYEEMEQIRRIAKTLKLDQQDFINAKLKIPREKRED
ncbi:MAG: hypothetical protein GYB66_16375 [Chloroflexi bacterium]|nr:hypothetical protein [Chloroflexota bacterium]